MTDQEREEEDEKLGKGKKKDQVAYNFMQKFYHKGAFYQEEPGQAQQDQNGDVYERDYNLPTMEDKQDKTMLPSALQKRMGTFGRKGNSKWTHLANEDTTQFDPKLRVN